MSDQNKDLFGTEKTANGKSLKTFQMVGFLLVLFLAGGIGGWLAVAKISGAVIAPAVVTVNTNAQEIQHIDGGIVAAINVNDGDRVDAGSTLLRLQDTDLRARLGIIEGQRIELLTEQARLEAERAKAEAVEFPEEIVSMADQADVKRAIEGQLSLFTAQRELLDGRAEQLTKQVEQGEKQIIGLEAQLRATQKQRSISEKELTDVKDLLAKELVSATRALSLEREMAGLEGREEQIRSEIARLEGAVSETKLRNIQLERENTAAILTRLAEIRTNLVTLLENKIAAEAQLARIDILAPRSGTIHELSVHTIGGVIERGQVVMKIIPNDEGIALQGRVEPDKIDQVFIGQNAVLRFPALDSRTTPELNGTVDRVGADLSIDRTTGLSFFEVRVLIAKDELALLDGKVLRPGMPAEAYMQTGERSALSYLVRPLADFINKAMRER